MHLTIVKKWVYLSLLSLAISAFYSIFVFLLKAQLFNGFFDSESIIQAAFIVLVDLSVLFWIVCFIMMLIVKDNLQKFNDIISIIQDLLFFSMGLIFISPFIGESAPYISNYIPILHNIFFIIAIGIFISSLFIISIIAILSKNPSYASIGILGFLTIISFAISAYKVSLIEYPIDQHSFYEMLFFGGGHIIQYLYCAGLIYVWFEFVEEIETLVPLKIFLALNTIFVLPLPFIQFFFAADSNNYFSLFSEHMRIFVTIAPVSLILVVAIISLFSKNNNREDRTIDPRRKLKKTVFLLSSLLFLFCSIISLFTNHDDVIPSYYRGSVIAISIAIMGYIYLLVDEYFAKINYKNATYQLSCYAFAQLMHISIIAYLGDYSAITNSFTYNTQSNSEKFLHASWLMAIISSLFFVYICSSNIFFHTKLNKKNYVK